MSTAELASSYAALILADDGVEITADKLQTLIKAAKIEEVEPIWTSLFAKALEGKDVKDLLSNVGSGGGAAPAAAGAAAGGAATEAAAEEAPKEEGTFRTSDRVSLVASANACHREGGVRRRHGLRSLRLSGFLRRFPFCTSNAWFRGFYESRDRKGLGGGTISCCLDRVALIQ
ncbi:60s Acidic ribosomal protein [Colletotrichum chrysophilum]|uniref:Large ribosomal subunit protein P1 n=2 Tax=Colletotrichum gloeosporioides species complex TaxID=2707338 RepID=A0AAD9A2P1_9PEZI|nr:60s Acidic ribosomal protein [Colletotrichum chrysophilum]